MILPVITTREEGKFLINEVLDSLEERLWVLESGKFNEDQIYEVNCDLRSVTSTLLDESHFVRNNDLPEFLKYASKAKEMYLRAFGIVHRNVFPLRESYIETYDLGIQWIDKSCDFARKNKPQTDSFKN